MNEWMHGWINKRNCFKNGWKDESTKWLYEWMIEWSDEKINKWMNEILKSIFDKWMNESINEHSMIDEMTCINEEMKKW